MVKQIRVPSFAFFLLAKVPPSFPKNESSFFLDDGDLGVVGDFGEEGDFWGEDAMELILKNTSPPGKKSVIPQLMFANLIFSHETEAEFQLFAQPSTTRFPCVFAFLEYKSLPL